MSGHTSESVAEPRSRLRELPPSAKLVAKTLEYEGELTQAELAEQSLLPDRTVRSALADLQEADLVSSRVSITDARQQLYTLDAADG